MDTDTRLRACWLSRLERAVLLSLLPLLGPRTMPQVLDLVEAHLGEPVGEGTLKFALARLVEVGVLASRHGRRGGYSVTALFRQVLAA